MIYDAVIIGGGFYGAVISLYLSKSLGCDRILLLEGSSSIMSRASKNNQARVHHGYHYPRNFNTAYRSKINYPQFELDWGVAISHQHEKLYGIPKSGSNISPQFFRRFSERLGVPLVPASEKIKNTFNRTLIEDVFVAKESVFDAQVLSNYLGSEIEVSNVNLMLSSLVTGVFREDKLGLLRLEVNKHGCNSQEFHAKNIFNCTYSNLNHLDGDFSGVRSGLKHEIAEMALMELPEEIAHYGITIMDGPFFSLMPYPIAGVHTLSHVRYTPHMHWHDEAGVSPYERLNTYEKFSRYQLMLRDAVRYIPAMGKAKYHGSLFEIKTVLKKNELDDGRPILFEECNSMPRFYSVLGGKLDNIYDVLDKLGQLDLN